MGRMEDDRRSGGKYPSGLVRPGAASGVIFSCFTTAWFHIGHDVCDQHERRAKQPDQGGDIRDPLRGLEPARIWRKNYGARGGGLFVEPTPVRMAAGRLRDAGVDIGIGWPLWGDVVFGNAERMALGASTGDVLRMVVRQALRLIGVGVAIGLAGAVAVTRVLSNFLFGVRPIDLPTFAVVSVVLIAVALVATYLPALRATRVDPVVALRYE